MQLLDLEDPSFESCLAALQHVPRSGWIDAGVLPTIYPIDQRSQQEATQP